MSAEVIEPQGSPVNSASGKWEYVQNPESGAIERKWIPDDPTTASHEGGSFIMPCLVRGVITSGYRGAGAEQTFGKEYTERDYIKMYYPASYTVHYENKISSIRDSKGNLVWVENTIDGTPPTVFDVFGIVPVLDPFGKYIENYVLLKRAEVQMEVPV